MRMHPVSLALRYLKGARTLHGRPLRHSVVHHRLGFALMRKPIVPTSPAMAYDT